MPESKTSVKRVLGWERVSDTKPANSDNKLLKEDDADSMGFDAFADANGNPKLDEDGSPIPMPDSYRTLSQNDFLRDYIIDGIGIISIVHFYDEGSKHYTAVDGVLAAMSQKYTDIHFLRLNGKDAPLVSKKLSITRAPVVLAMKNREVRDRISHFGESEFFAMQDECRMLYQWVSKKLAPPE